MADVRTDPREAGRQGGLKSAETRRRKAEQRAAMRADLRARQAFVDAAPDIAEALLDAALGRGDFASLDPKERMGLLKTCLEYGVGRPRPQDPMTVEDDEEDSTGIRFGVRTDEGHPAEPREPGEVRPQPPQG